MEMYERSVERRQPRILRKIKRQFDPIVEFALKNVSKGKSLKALAELVQKAEAIPVGDVKLTNRECYFQEKVSQKAEALLNVCLDTNAVSEKRKLLFGTLIILEWSRSAAWFRESPCRDYKSLWYWFGVKESCIKSGYHVQSMTHYAKVCLGQYPGEILKCSKDDLRDLKLRQLLAKDPIRFEILKSLAEVFQKILQKSSGEWKITAIPLASVFGLSEPFVRDLTAKSSRCVAAELKKARDNIKERSDQWYGNLGAILSSRDIFADRPSDITLVDLHVCEQDPELGTGCARKYEEESVLLEKKQISKLLNSCMVVDVQDIYMNTAFWMGI
ncbi:hypothetical protein HDV02_000580 [Globomyces sp. JEL0801]|nr:hypothetical protein HDV02_000580 [Globomyces sp. JEL0801]